eukprot:Pgem_evm3s933
MINLTNKDFIFIKKYFEPQFNICPIFSKELNNKTGNCIVPCNTHQVRDITTKRCRQNSRLKPKNYSNTEDRKQYCRSISKDFDYNSKSHACITKCKNWQTRNSITNRCTGSFLQYQNKLINDFINRQPYVKNMYNRMLNNEWLSDENFDYLLRIHVESAGFVQNYHQSRNKERNNRLVDPTNL